MKVLKWIKEYFEILFYFFKYGNEEGNIRWRIKKLEDDNEE